MAWIEKITDWRVLCEDGKNCAWVNGRYWGTVPDEWVAWFEQVCPTTLAPRPETGAAKTDNLPSPVVSGG